MRAETGKRDEAVRPWADGVRWTEAVVGGCRTVMRPYM
jgi:hypothetical protein